MCTSYWRMSSADGAAFGALSAFAESGAARARAISEATAATAARRLPGRAPEPRMRSRMKSPSFSRTSGISGRGEWSGGWFSDELVRVCRSSSAHGMSRSRVNKDAMA
ncbi:hypothetical protein [Streptomyces sp. NBC_01373]|uniref:hypothetical protein n=1 Tax=Streptomyces sp. NBC_01373 TaxID=2903843 RepID=UPI00338FF904